MTVLSAQEHLPALLCLVSVKAQNNYYLSCVSFRGLLSDINHCLFLWAFTALLVLVSRSILVTDCEHQNNGCILLL